MKSTVSSFRSSSINAATGDMRASVYRIAAGRKTGDRTKVSLLVDQHMPHVPFLGHANQRRIDDAFTVRVIVTAGIAGDLGALDPRRTGRRGSDRSSPPEFAAATVSVHRERPARHARQSRSSRTSDSFFSVRPRSAFRSADFVPTLYQFHCRHCPVHWNQWTNLSPFIKHARVPKSMMLRPFEIQFRTQVCKFFESRILSKYDEIHNDSNQNPVVGKPLKTGVCEAKSGCRNNPVQHPIPDRWMKHWLDFVGRLVDGIYTRQMR